MSPAASPNRSLEAARARLRTHPVTRLAGAALARRAPFPLARPSWPGTVERPAPERHLGAAYDTAWSRRYPVRLARAVVVDNVLRPATHVVASPRVYGEERLATLEPPLIFVANHASHLDTPLVVSVLPARLRHHLVVAAAADHFFDRAWKAHLWAFALGAVPIERQRVSRRSADVAAGLVEAGWSLLIFPEGGRSPDGWAREFRGGAAYLGVRTGRPVVPVHLDGTHGLLPKGGRLRRGSVVVTFGAALWAGADEDARRFGARIEAAVATLADERATDFYRARRRAAAGTTPPLAGPSVAPWRRAWALGTASGAGADPRDDPGRWALERRH